MDSTADKGAGRLKLGHYFNCVDKCCSHDVVFEDSVLYKGIDVTSFDVESFGSIMAW